MKHSWLAYSLWLLGGFGVLGLHRFYLNRWPSGLLWFGTAGLLGVGAIVDLFRLREMVEVENLAHHLLAQALDSDRPVPQPV